MKKVVKKEKKIKVEMRSDFEKRMDNIAREISGLIKDYDGEVVFHSSFVVFNKEGDVEDDRIFCFGDKDTLKISIDDILEQIEKEDDDFVNW